MEVPRIAVMQDEVLVLNVRVLVQVVDAVGIEERGSALDAVYPILFTRQKLCKIKTALVSDACNQGAFHIGNPALFTVLSTLLMEFTSAFTFKPTCFSTWGLVPLGGTSSTPKLMSRDSKTPTPAITRAIASP